MSAQRWDRCHTCVVVEVLHDITKIIIMEVSTSNDDKSRVIEVLSSRVTDTWHPL